MSVRPVAPASLMGRQVRRIAANGTRLLKKRFLKARRRALAGRQAPDGGSTSSISRACRRKLPGESAALPSMTAFAAAAWCRVQHCWSAAIPASANPPCCFRSSASLAKSRAVPTSPAKKRSIRCGCAPLAWASPSAGRSWPPRPVRDIVATLDAATHPACASSIRSRLCGRRCTSGAGHGGPGARRRQRADPRRQAARHGRDPGRPRHQGRHHRGPPRAGAHGRHRPLFRRRARPPVPHPARGEEPVRRRPTRSACSK